MMQTAFLLDHLAVILRHWFEIGPRDEEHGCRVEIRTLVRSAHVGTESAAQPVTLDLPLWRADIFDLVGAPPGNLTRAHFHPAFNGREPVDRHWEPMLQADWRGWLHARLTDLPGTLQRSGDADISGADRLAAGLPRLLDHAETLLGVNCTTPADCLDVTVDTRHATALMLQQFREAGASDPRTVLTP
jgi:hypothetical protein